MISICVDIFFPSISWVYWWWDVISLYVINIYFYIDIDLSIYPSIHPSRNIYLYNYIIVNLCHVISDHVPYLHLFTGLWTISLQVSAPHRRVPHQGSHCRGFASSPLAQQHQPPTPPWQAFIHGLIVDMAEKSRPIKVGRSWEISRKHMGIPWYVDVFMENHHL